MKIEKYIKDKSNKYKIIIDGETFILYDDIIVKYSLIMKDSISEAELATILADNERMKSYYDSIKYINRKLRSEKEIREYLLKRDVSNYIIEETITKLKENNFLNEDNYLKAYINDQINLTNNGPKKITTNLLHLGFSSETINASLSKISSSIWNEKIKKYIEKKINTNHKSSKYMLKMKITNDLINLGFIKEDIIDILNKYDIIDKDIYNLEYEKAKRQLEKKWSGKELDRKIKERLFRKGFNVMGEDYEE